MAESSGNGRSSRPSIIGISETKQPSRDVIFIYVREVKRKMDRLGIDHSGHTNEEIWAAVMEICKRGAAMYERFKGLHNVDPTLTRPT